MIEESTNRERIHPVLVGLVLAVVVGGSLFAWMTRPVPSTSWGVTEISAEFDRIHGLPGAVQQGDRTTLVKYGVSAVSARYLLRASERKILSYYRTQFESAGWKFASNMPGATTGVRLCKPNLLASIEMLRSRATDIAEYEISITSGDISARECP